MVQDILVDGSSPKVKDYAVINIWCSNSEISERIATLLHATLTRTAIRITDQWEADAWHNPEASYVLITDRAQHIQEMDRWLQENPDLSVSLLYILGDGDSVNPSLEGMRRFKNFQRLDKDHLNWCDTLVKGLLYPVVDNYIRTLEADKQKKDMLISHIKKQLSVFYHNINNPLTVLSGNLQLLQILTESESLSGDVQKSIQDITEISGRFEADLQHITSLRKEIEEQA